MNDYVSRQYLLNEYDRQHEGPPGGARKIIAEAPAASVAPIVPGRWIPVTSIYKVADKQWPFTHIVWVEVTEFDEANGLKCSVCGDVHSSVEMWNWCSNCGAKMTGKREGNEQDGYYRCAN